MPDPTLEEAVEQCCEALLALREAERELGWALAQHEARKKLDEGGLAFLLDADDTISDPRD